MCVHYAMDDLILIILAFIAFWNQTFHVLLAHNDTTHSTATLHFTVLCIFQQKDYNSLFILALNIPILQV